MNLHGCAASINRPLLSISSGSIQSNLGNSQKRRLHPCFLPFGRRRNCSGRRHGENPVRLDAKFRIRITQRLDEKIISEIVADKPQLVILTDFGSGYLDMLNEKIPNFKVLILDHHQVNGTSSNPNFVQVNPTCSALTAQQTSAAQASPTSLLKREPSQRRFSAYGFGRRLGDMQDKYDQRKLCKPKRNNS